VEAAQGKGGEQGHLWAEPAQWTGGTQERITTWAMPRGGIYIDYKKKGLLITDTKKGPHIGAGSYG